MGREQFNRSACDRRVRLGAQRLQLRDGAAHHGGGFRDVLSSDPLIFPTMNTPTILITRCYAETTPESAENGENSDSGFVYEDVPFTFTELVHEIANGGFHRDGATEWLSTYPQVESYETATEREESLHFSRANPDRLRKWFNLAARVANPCNR